jgi:small Trp-rich protein
MWAVWIGVVMIALKVLGIEPVAGLAWWWVLAPLGLALVWFEGLEKVFGRDKRHVEHAEWEARKRKRVEEQFAQLRKPAGTKPKA